MVTVPGYQVVEQLYESSRSLVYRAQRDSDQAAVVLKILRQEYPSPKAIARFQMEYEILSNLNLEGVIKAYGLATYQQSPVIVLEDFGGESLHQWLQKRIFNLEDFLTLAIQITSILGEIHQQNIMHKDINPSNILLNSATGQVKMIDFGIATVLPQETPMLQHPTSLEGTLAYMSPEQTGRMNRAVDYRTDFYSLGATFYQLLCDRLPFAATDSMELVHCHLARQPIPPHEMRGERKARGVEAVEKTGEVRKIEGVIVPRTSHLAPRTAHKIPEAVSNIVLKLLAKSAEDRYQSTWGIETDLQECLHQLQQTQQIEFFSVGKSDISSKFQIPQKLYGREREVEVLLEAFERVSGMENEEWRIENVSEACRLEEGIEKSQFPILNSQFTTKLMLVSGSPGIGKTTLVQELYKPITRQRGYFIAGKFDQLQRNIPYFALIQAFQELVRQLLTEGEEQIASWREKLLMALGSNGQVIVDVIPELELILGNQADVVELPLAELHNRFNWVFQNFIQVFTKPVGKADAEYIHPLVIFLDDLQWADTASLYLIQQLITGQGNQRLLLIGTYRDNEIDVAHPLAHALNEIRKAGGEIDQITLSSLELADINQLVQDIFHCDTGRSQPLSELLIQKTDGNPFFLNEFLKSLHEKNLLDFDIKQGVWQWNLQQIQSAQLTDNVVELVINRIHKLPAQSQHTLCLASCISNQFDLHTLVAISECSLLETATNLWAPMQEGLIIPIGDDYKYVGTETSESKIQLFFDSLIYKFSHDRIQQAAHSLISDTNRKHYHLKIGQQLLKSVSLESVEDKIFDIVDHLNLGAELVADQGQKDQLAQLNLIAGNKAKSSVAYEAALKYLNIGRSLLANDSWQKAYELTLRLAESRAEAAYLTGNFEQMEQQIAEVLLHVKTALEQTNVYRIKIQAYIAQNRLLDAIQMALQVLELLGITLPKQPSQEDIAQGLNQTKRLLAERQIEDLLNLARMTDPNRLAAMQVISSVCTPTYFLAPQLWELMVFQKIQLSVNYGNAPGSAFGYADYGMILCGEENIDAGFQFSQLAVTLQPQLNAKEFIPKTSLLVNMYLRHWREHLKETLNSLLEAYQCGLETGDLEYATFAIAFRFYHSYLIGRELIQLEQEMASYKETIAQFKQALPLNLTQIYQQAVLNLMGRSNNPCCLVGDSYNEEERLSVHLAANDQYTVFHLYLNKLMLWYLFQQYTQAAECATTLTQLLSEGAVGLLVVPIFHFYDSLAKIAAFPEASASEQQQFLQAVTVNQEKMKHWADHAPMNYLHKFHLVEAERRRILGQETEAADAYDRAIDLANEHEYLNEAALANELAAKFYLAKGKPKIAQVYWLDARYCYLKWGATAKVQDLEQRYPQFCDRRPERTSTTSSQRSSSPTTTSITRSDVLDLAALMRAFQALSGEIVLEKLLATLMTILIENAGAERGCLILQTNGKLTIEAEGTTDPTSIVVLRSIPIAQDVLCHVPTTIVNYVVRTQESIVLNHATQDYRFSQDSYILQQQPKSILCTPLVYQGKLSGILYLENNLTTDAFTPERLEILQFLSTQAAISIDNAQLYNQLEQRVQERTIELTQMNDRLHAEILERQRSEQVLRLIVEGTAAVTGEDFFRSLVRSLADALNVRYALISGCVDTSLMRVRTFAFWHGHEFGENFEYDLVGTPCEQVINGSGCQFYARDVQSLFPDDDTLVDWQAESYLGIALLNSSGRILGHLAVLDDQPMQNKSRNQSVLEIFAARAATEMERKQAEAALRMSEEKFSTAFRSSPDAITISTLNDGRCIEVNDSCLQMLGYRREEMIGQSTLELGIWVTPEDRDTIKYLLQEQGSISQVEFWFRRKSGETFPGLYSAEIIHLDDQPCLLSVTADITALKQAEKALERLAEIGELAAMIVHEVRNPLTTISMGLTSFRRLQLPERFQEYLSLALAESDRLQRLLNQILLYARPQMLQRSELELNGFIVDMLNVLQPMPAALGKHLNFVAISEPVRVSADRDKLKQIFINLVTNACEAVNEGDTIEVSMQTVENHQVRVQIHNGGIPIPTEVLPKLTKPFFTTKPSGNGLGLAIVKRIIEAHNGELRIESSAVTGTTVKVVLPLAIADSYPV